jgi:DNA-binding MarR family transcriptional regulator
MEDELRVPGADIADEFDARLTDIKRLFAQAARAVPGEAGDEAGVLVDKLTLARVLLWARMEIESQVGGDLFANPALSILMTLYVSRCEGGAVSTSAACAASGVPTTTALRWINALAHRNMLLKRSGPHDRRFTYLELSDATFAAIDRFLIHMRDRLVNPGQA